MNELRRRPFYAEYAWAFDLLIDRPVRQECAVIAAWLIDRGVLPGAEILDAGCGTGRYALELARRGYVVRGVDLSPELVDIAALASRDSTGRVSFGVGDIAHLPTSRYAAILCRGVLNDIIDDAGRDAVFGAFAEALQSNGVLILDVREWGASLERKTREPFFRKRVSTDRGELTFTSVTALDPENRQLLVSERHELTAEGEGRISDYHFVMRCWEKEELSSLLARHAFGNVSCFGAYDPGVAIGATDRLVVVAQRRPLVAGSGWRDDEPPKLKRHVAGPTIDRPANLSRMLACRARVADVDSAAPETRNTACRRELGLGRR